MGKLPESIFQPKTTWVPAARNWAHLQFDHLNNKETQEVLIKRLSVCLEANVLGPRLLAAMELGLPGPDILSALDVAKHAGAVQKAAWVVVFRYYSDDEFAMQSRLTTVVKSTVVLYSPDKGIGTIGDLMALAATSPGAQRALMGAAEYVSSVARSEGSHLRNPPGQVVKGQTVNVPDEHIPMTRRLGYHQTGSEKDDDPYISCSCVLPCVDASPCHVVQRIRKETPFLGLFIVPGANIRVLWPDANFVDFLCESKSKKKTNMTITDANRLTLNQMEKNWVGMIKEREVAYIDPPPLNTWLLTHVNNPNHRAV